MMRRLYFKILLHWCVSLIATEILIFGLVFLLIKDGHQASVIAANGRTIILARDYLETALASPPGQSEDTSATMRKAVEHLGKTMHAKVWLTRADGAPLAASFTGSVKPPGVNFDQSAPYGNALINVKGGPNRLSYSTVSVTLGAYREKAITLHVLTERESWQFPYEQFGGGLIVICIGVALIAIPISRHITKQLKRLQDSALRIAGGDLSARAEIRGNDEISSLGMAFNSMADTVERMVQAGKELTANVSHGMRSPLARIRVAGECLQGAMARGDTADAEELLEGMWEDIDEADRMIGRVLEYSKLDLHEPLPPTSEVWPAILVEGLLKAMRPLFSSKGVTVDTALDPLLSVAGDEVWLRSALKNVLENAAHYTPDGGNVRITLHSEADHVVLEVTNTSPPLSDKDLERLFDPFYRGTGAQGDGTGLGLAITRKTILLHRGDIDARNTPHGFHIRLCLPRFAGEERA